MRIEIEVAPGELVDKATILEIKLEKITDWKKRKSIEAESKVIGKGLARLRNHLEGNKRTSEVKVLNELRDRLKDINLKIWQIEDDIRECEREQDFSNKFVQLARSVYLTNDERARVKKEISTLFNSDISEEKSYTEYRQKTDSAANVEACNKAIAEHSRRNKR